MMKALDLSVFLGGLSNAVWLQCLASGIGSVVWSAVPIANNRRPERWRRLASYSPGRLETAEAFVKYNPRTRKEFVTEIRSPREMKLLTQPSPSRPDPAVPAR